MAEDKLKEELGKLLKWDSHYFPEGHIFTPLDHHTSNKSENLASRVVREFDREILKRIGDSLHMLMPNVEISIKNASIEVMRPIDQPDDEFFVLKMELKLSAQNPEDFLKTPDMPKEEVSRVFRVE